MESFNNSALHDSGKPDPIRKAARSGPKSRTGPSTIDAHKAQTTKNIINELIEVSRNSYDRQVRIVYGRYTPFAPISQGTAKQSYYPILPSQYPRMNSVTNQNINPYNNQISNLRLSIHPKVFPEASNYTSKNHCQGTNKLARVLPKEYMKGPRQFNTILSNKNSNYGRISLPRYQNNKKWVVKNPGGSSGSSGISPNHQHMSRSKMIDARNNIKTNFFCFPPTLIPSASFDSISEEWTACSTPQNIFEGDMGRVKSCQETGGAFKTVYGVQSHRNGFFVYGPEKRKKDQIGKYTREKKKR